MDDGSNGYESVNDSRDSATMAAAAAATVVDGGTFADTATADSTTDATAAKLANYQLQRKSDQVWIHIYIYLIL